MRVLLALAVLLAASVVAQEDTPKKAKKAPIVSTDIVHGTAEFIYDVYEAIYSKFVSHHVNKHSATVLKAIDPLTEALPKDPITEVCAKVGCKKGEVLKVYTQVKASLASTLEVAMASAAQLHELLMQWTNFVVNGFELAMPKYEGLIPKTPANLAMFVIYFTAVLYVLLRVVLFGLRMGLGIFCFVFCCGCCPRRKVAPATNGKGSKAVEKGKAALGTKTATTPAPAPKPKTKK